MNTVAQQRGPAKIFLIAAEESGDRLGQDLMKALRAELGGAVTFSGVGGRSMNSEGLMSLFTVDDLSIVGFAEIPRRLPLILRRIREASLTVLRERPDVLVIIDSPDFTHRVARRVRSQDPSIPIVDYVSPTVWAWRTGRARAMCAYIDRVLALLPFEPEAYRRLGGPPCDYVGHPLLEHIGSLTPLTAEAAARATGTPQLLVLPGSRRSEIRRHIDIFGETLAQLRASGVSFDAVLPTLPHLENKVREAVKAWPVAPRIVVGEDERRAAYRNARAALAKSGTVTLELALARVPMVAAYKVSAWEAAIARRVIATNTVILANLVIGENVVPEFLQNDCRPDRLALALHEILGEGPSRQRQLDAFSRLRDIMSTGDRAPSQRAADLIIAAMRQPRRK